MSRVDLLWRIQECIENVLFIFGQILAAESVFQCSPAGFLAVLCLEFLIFGFQEAELDEEKVANALNLWKRSKLMNFNCIDSNKLNCQLTLSLFFPYSKASSNSRAVNVAASVD